MLFSVNMAIRRLNMLKEIPSMQKHSTGGYELLLYNSNNLGSRLFYSSFISTSFMIWDKLDFEPFKIMFSFYSFHLINMN